MTYSIRDLISILDNKPKHRIGGIFQRQNMSFTCFPTLPPELRRKIFQEACYITRILDIWPKIHFERTRDINVGGDKVIFDTHARNPPAILRELFSHGSIVPGENCGVLLTWTIDVCREARDVGLEQYQCFFGTHFKRVLGGGPLYLSERPRIYVNWKSDIICPILDLPTFEIDVMTQRLLREFVLSFLSRLPLFRIAISTNSIRTFQEKFGHDLAWSRNHKEVIVFVAAPRFSIDQDFKSGKPGTLKFSSPENGRDDRPDGDVYSFATDDLNSAVEDLRDNVIANRERCPALAGPFFPMIQPMIMGFDGADYGEI